MPRPRTPDCELTHEQRKRRERNERYREKLRSARQKNLKPTHKAKQSLAIEKPQQISNISENRVLKDVSNEIASKTERETTRSAISLVENPDPLPNRLAHSKLLNYLGLIFLGSVLATCCMLSYFLQLEMYESLHILPTLSFAGIEFTKITAVLVELLLVLLAGLALSGRNVTEKVSACALFLVIGGGNAVLLWHGQEVSLHHTITAATVKSQAALRNNGTVLRLTDQRRALEQQRDALIKQIDINNTGSFAASGAIGLVRDSMTKLDQIQSRIENIDREILSNTEGSVPQRRIRDQIMYERTTLAAEVFRILLLMVTAFLVHSILVRVRVQELPPKHWVPC